MRFAVACLIATSQAIKIRSTDCPTAYSATPTTALPNLWHIAGEACYGSAAVPTLSCDGTSSHISIGDHTVPITADGDNKGCYATALAQKKEDECDAACETAKAKAKKEAELAAAAAAQKIIDDRAAIQARIDKVCAEGDGKVACDKDVVDATAELITYNVKYPVSLSQKKSTACPTDTAANWTTVEDSTKLWRVGDENCYKTVAPHTCPTGASHISSGNFTVDTNSDNCFTQPPPPQILNAQKKSTACPTGFQAESSTVDSIAYTHAYTHEEGTCYGSTAPAKTCDNENASNASKNYQAKSTTYSKALETGTFSGCYGQ